MGPGQTPGDNTFLRVANQAQAQTFTGINDAITVLMLRTEQKPNKPCWNDERSLGLITKNPYRN